jgi:hypothetical protein
MMILARESEADYALTQEAQAVLSEPDDSMNP